MQVIICNTQQHIQLFRKQITGKSIYIIPVFQNLEYHAKLNLVSVYIIYDQSTSTLFVLPENHSEAIQHESFTNDLKLASQLIVLNKKEFLYHCDAELKSKVNDLNLIFWLNRDELLTFDFENDYSFYSKIKSNVTCSLIPLVKYVEYSENIINTIKTIHSESILASEEYVFYNKLISLFYEIERNGICASKEAIDIELQSKLGKNNYIGGLLFSHYNLYTMTGRPTCTTNSINLTALNKKDGTRGMIVSRFNSGNMLEFDFEAYHLRIIADLIKYKFPKEIPVYNYLGKYYFGTTNITQEQYDESKRITFKQLYGGVEPKYKNIEYYKRVFELINSLWKQWNDCGYIQSPVSKRKFIRTRLESDMHPQKLFNYFIQMMETEYSIFFLENVLQVLKSKKSKLVLYQYDSLLIDLHPNESNLISGIKNILEHGDFVVRCKLGNNYNSMRLYHVDNEENIIL